jgi:hypothetical protein
MTEVAQLLGYFFHGKSDGLIFSKWVVPHFGRVYHKLVTLLQMCLIESMQRLTP